MNNEAAIHYDINSTTLPELVQTNEDEGIGILVSMAKEGKITLKRCQKQHMNKKQ